VIAWAQHISGIMTNGRARIRSNETKISYVWGAACRGRKQSA